MTGIERLRGVAGFWRENRLEEIVEQIEREQGGHVSRMRVLAVITDMERHVSGHEGMEDSPVARWARELREALTKNEVEKMKCDPAEDVSMSAYGLLPEEDRDAIAWVREHGGLDAVKRRWECLSYYDDPVPRSYAERRIASRQRQIDESHAALRRRNARVAELEREVKHQQDVGAVHLERIGELVDENKELRARVENQRASLDGLTAAIGELRPRLMPEGMEWPRFEDGEPVRIGDEISWRDEGGVVNSIELQDGGYFIINAADGAEDWIHPQYFPGERVKRPAPKVLDADGAEIRVGDEVWHVLGEFGPRVVSKFETHDGRQVAVFEPNGSDLLGCECDQLTHHAPVLAADGKPLREGETVWYVPTPDEAIECVVDELPNRDKGEGQVTSKATHRNRTIVCPPSYLTHERPEPKDSWVKWRKNLEADALGCAQDAYHGLRTSIDFDKFMRRAKALAERDA